MREAIDRYVWLQAHREKCDALYRRRFNRFYRVRRGPDWQNKFYDLFESLKGQRQAAPFIDVVDALCGATGRYEVSFASKLVATIDPEMPVIDVHVLRNLKLRLPASGSTDRLGRLEALHRGLVTALHAFLTTEIGQYLVGRFRQMYPHAPITETKMLDFVLWQTRSPQQKTDRNASPTLTRRSTESVAQRQARQHRKTIVLIACASKKLSHCAKAEDLYASDLFRKNLAYARKMRPASIFILSAKYELVQPADEICPYDVTLKRMSAAQIRSWSDRVFAQLKMRTDVEHDHFVFLAGKEYRKYLVPRLRSADVPMKGLGIGEQLQYLKNHLA